MTKGWDFGWFVPSEKLTNNSTISKTQPWHGEKAGDEDEHDPGGHRWHICFRRFGDGMNHSVLLMNCFPWNHRLRSEYSLVKEILTLRSQRILCLVPCCKSIYVFQSASLCPSKIFTANRLIYDCENIYPLLITYDSFTTFTSPTLSVTYSMTFPQVSFQL